MHSFIIILRICTHPSTASKMLVGVQHRNVQNHRNTLQKAASGNPFFGRRKHHTLSWGWWLLEMHVQWMLRDAIKQCIIWRPLMCSSRDCDVTACKGRGRGEHCSKKKKIKLLVCCETLRTNADGYAEDRILNVGLGEGSDHLQETERPSLYSRDGILIGRPARCSSCSIHSATLSFLEDAMAFWWKGSPLTAPLPKWMCFSSCNRLSSALCR